MGNSKDNVIKDLKLEILELQSRLDRLYLDEILLLSIKQSPFIVWACNEQRKIVFWSDNAEKNYGINRDEAIGEDFTTLFVDEIEREQAAIDCADIIQNNKRFHNFLADDHDIMGNKIRMLTNSFRIKDFKGNLLQVEISLKIPNLDLANEKHRELREIAIINKTMKNRYLKLEQEKLRKESLDIYNKQMRELDEKVQIEKDYLNKLKLTCGTSIPSAINYDKEKEIIENNYYKFIGKTEKCQDVDSCDLVFNELQLIKERK